MADTVIPIIMFTVFTAVILLIAFNKEKNDKNLVDPRRQHTKFPMVNDNVNEIVHITPRNNETINFSKSHLSKDTSFGLISDKNVNLSNTIDDPLAEIVIEKIATYMHGMRPLIGSDQVPSTVRKHEYVIDLGRQTCTCDYFSKKKHFPVNDARRFCYHMIKAFGRRNAFENVQHRTRMVAELGSVWPITSAYAFKHAKLPLMYLLVEDENPWLSIYARKKNSAENVYTASGDFVRHSYNILEGRWSYSDGVPGASILRPFFKSITALEHIDATVDQVSRRPQPMTLSQKSDPRLAADNKSDQFGPKIDHYEIPESSLKSEYPCECSLLFSYFDGKGYKSRRTVDFKKLQFYGSEGYFLYGECRMRKAGRTFNTKKMTNVIDVQTGEVITNVSEFTKALWAGSAKAQLQEWAQKNERIAKAFLFLLKGNKRATKSDYQALSTTFSELLGGVTVNTSDIQFLYDGQYPTTAVGFQRLVGGIVKHHPEQAQWFKQNAVKLVNARAKPNFADHASIEYVTKRIP